MRKKAILRIRIITGVVLFLSLILIVRLYQVQIVQRDYYKDKASSQYVHTVRDLYSRGSIYFSTKNDEKVSAATVQSGYLLSLDPSRIDDPLHTYEQINTVYPLDKEAFIFRANQKERTYFEIATELSNSEADLIAALDLTGVQLYRDRWRYYPGEELSSRTVGFVGFTSDSGSGLTGRYGLERYYEEVLVRDEHKMSVNFFAEIFSNLGSIIFDTTETRTGDVVTTIEPTVARMLDSELMKTQEKWNSSLTGGIIINPKTGEIYAMNAVPTFNLNNRIGTTIDDFKNPLAEDVHEFGSIIKALTMAAGIDSGSVSPSTTYYDAGFLEMDTYTISNYDGRGRGTVNMQEVLNQSLNTGVAFVVKTMGKDRFREYFKALKLGQETGIDLPNEAYGLVANLDSPRDIEYATASYGQGIALTPIATVRALSALGNGGKLITPHIAKRIEYQDGSVKEVQYPEGDKVFSSDTSLTISRMLTTVVDDALRNGNVKLDNYSIAAKTGTAQIADSEDGGYYDDRYLHSFFGYFPSYDPEFLVFLYTVEPKEVRYSSETLTDPFMEITKFLINYYNLPPDR
ncbi:MAG: stage V sporulation protein D (sporulation-specific penicillin-binding protein) [Acidimicrobiales bacterium]|jgi:stage V sporulation protein D (sporulation-specific penicillin-binding protein)